MKTLNYKKRKANKQKEIIGWLFMIPMLFILYYIIVRPQVTGISLSFFKLKGYTPVEFCGFDNYIRVFKDKEFIPTLINTIKYVLWSLVIGFPIPIILAFLLNEMVHLKKIFRVFIYLPSVVPIVVYIMLWKMIYNPGDMGLLNVILSKLNLEPYMWLNDGKFTILYIVIAMTWHSAGGTMLLYFASLQSISTELYEAVTIDGGGLITKFIHVSLPQTGSIIILSLVRQIIAVFQILQEPMVMTSGGPVGASNSLGYLAYKYGFVSGRVGNALALGTIMFVILIFATIFYFKIDKKLQDNI